MDPPALHYDASYASSVPGVDAIEVLAPDALSTEVPSRRSPRRLRVWIDRWR